MSLFFQQSAKFYNSLYRIPGLAPMLDWLKPRLILLIPRLRDFNASTRLSQNVRRELETHQRLLESFGQALAGLHDWSAEQSHARHSLEDRLAANEDRLAANENRLAANSEGLLARIQTLEGHLVGASGNAGIWSRLERIESAQHRSARQTEDRFQQLRERIEWVRSEMLFELRHVARIVSPTPAGHRSPTTEPLAPRILNPDKLASQQQAVRLNLGCGHLIDAERLNVDTRELPGVDLLADVADLPFDPGTLAEIHAAHLLEHFPEQYLRDRLLPYWHGLLRPDGELRLIVPDALAMLDAYREGRTTFADLRLVTFGGQDYDGDFHYTMFSPDSLKALLERGGFRSSELVTRARANGVCLEMEILARP